MRKFFLALVLVFITGASLFAWEPNDLTKFPIGQDGKNWILNFGIGFTTDTEHLRKDYIYILPLRLSLDKNVAMGDKKLPFFIGGILGYTGYGYTWHNYTYYNGKWHDKEFFYHDILMAGRFGYHFNWAVKNLDTYAVTTAGWIAYAGDYDKYGKFLLGVNLGARYFVSKGFGFWVETGFNAFSWLDIGLAFKF
jgi:hypothetical protein